MEETASIIYRNIVDRRSIRTFTGEAIDHDEIDVIIRAGDAAPSAGNLKSRKFILIKERQEIEGVFQYVFSKEFRKNRESFSRASALILLLANIKNCTEKYRRGRLYSIQDATLSGQNMLLMAHALGLGGCWIGQVRERKILDLHRVSNEYKLVGIIALGKIA